MSAAPELPLELKGFHRETVKKVSLMFIPVIVAAVIMGVGKSNPEVTVIDWVGLAGFIGGILVLLSYAFYRILLAIPSCPECGVKMRVINSIDDADVGAWRIFKCDKCRQKNRLVSLSSH
jgi:hypothetical protein